MTNSLGFSPDAAVIGEQYAVIGGGRDLSEKIRQAITNDFDGDNFQLLADKYQRSLHQVHLIIYSNDPDAYERSLRARADSVAHVSTAASTHYSHAQNTSASPDRARNRHRTGRHRDNRGHSGKRRNGKKSSASRCVSSNKKPVARTACSVRIDVDSLGLTCLQVSLAKNLVLELTFASDGRSAGKHRSCRG